MTIEINEENKDKIKKAQKGFKERLDDVKHDFIFYIKIFKIFK